MRKSIFVSLITATALSLMIVAVADAGIFGRGRGIFRGRWGSRNIGGCGASCSPGATCGPNGCAPGTNPSSSPKKTAAAPAVTMPVSP